MPVRPACPLTCCHVFLARSPWTHSLSSIGRRVPRGLGRADRLPSFFPLFMTAAGTIQPARCWYSAPAWPGCKRSQQPSASARRYPHTMCGQPAPTRSNPWAPPSITLDLEALEGSGGYAREMSEDRAERQREALTLYISDADVVITTAAVPGRQAPLLVTRAMVETMKPGSVVDDLASETGGNVEGSVSGEEILVGQVTVWGAKDVASEMPCISPHSCMR